MYGAPRGLGGRSPDESERLFYDLTHAHLSHAQSPAISVTQQLELEKRLPSLHLASATSSPSPLHADPSSLVESAGVHERYAALSARLKDVSSGLGDASSAMAALSEVEEILLRQQRATAALDTEEAAIRAILSRSGSVSTVSQPPAAAHLHADGPGSSGYDQRSVSVSQSYAWYYWQWAVWYHWQQHEEFRHQLQHRPEQQPYSKSISQGGDDWPKRPAGHQRNDFDVRAEQQFDTASRSKKS